MTHQDNRLIIRWGILGTGNIAAAFADALGQLPDAKLQAVASRTVSKASTFAGRYAEVDAYGSYEELVDAGDVDIVYVATPHHRHRDDCILCLEHGKPVLCEKPFTTCADEAREVVEVARGRSLFCMEAMWMRFMPIVREARDMLRRGDIGAVRLLGGDFGYPAEYDPENRLFNPALAGGALLDRGVYLISLAVFLFGEPDRVCADWGPAGTGVDEQCAVILGYHDGKLATFHSGLRIRSTNTASLYGTCGSLTLAEPFFAPETLILKRYGAAPSMVDGGSRVAGMLRRNAAAVRLARKLKSTLAGGTSIIRRPHLGSGYRFEAAEAMRCLRAGLTESPDMPLDESLAVMEIVDTVRSSFKQ